jgi:hypothetical protein
MSGSSSFVVGEFLTCAALAAIFAGMLRLRRIPPGQSVRPVFPIVVFALVLGSPAMWLLGMPSVSFTLAVWAAMFAWLWWVSGGDDDWRRRRRKIADWARSRLPKPAPSRVRAIEQGA